MSKETEIKHQATNSYTRIIQLSGPSKTGCTKCDAKKLPLCICPKSGSAENESEEIHSDHTEKINNMNSIQPVSQLSKSNQNSFDETNKENPMLILFGLQKEFQFTLKPNVKLADIKTLLEQFIIELADNEDVNIKELGKNLGIFYDDTEENTLAITMRHPEHFILFFSRLRDKELIVITQEQAQKIENIAPKENCQSFNPSPFSMTLTPFKGS